MKRSHLSRVLGASILVAGLVLAPGVAQASPRVTRGGGAGLLSSLWQALSAPVLHLFEVTSGCSTIGPSLDPNGSSDSTPVTTSTSSTDSSDTLLDTSFDIGPSLDPNGAS